MAATWVLMRGRSSANTTLSSKIVNKYKRAMADIAVAAPMHLHAYISLPLDPYPGIRAWMARVEALPCWENTDVVPLLGLDAQS